MPKTTMPKYPLTSTSTSTSTSTPNPNPVYFWRPAQGNGYLSQWYWSEFSTPDGSTYATAEMYMMVCKARLFGDEATARLMLGTTDPRRHKALGREVGGFDEKVWDEKKLDIVVQGNYLKFTACEDAERLRGLLLGTGDRELVEASPRDRIWGVGFAESEAGRNRYRWGENLLGKALERVRERLREEDGKRE